VTVNTISCAVKKYLNYTSVFTVLQNRYPWFSVLNIQTIGASKYKLLT